MYGETQEDYGFMAVVTVGVCMHACMHACMYVGSSGHAIRQFWFRNTRYVRHVTVFPHRTHSFSLHAIWYVP
jgi:hypothetical protein